jgi:acetoin utilization deacetylase AcuC-like enzyme
VLEAAKRNNIPLVASMGGGYSVDFRDIIEAHANTYRLAQEFIFKVFKH